MAKRTSEQIREAPAYVVAEAAHYLALPKSTLRAWCVGQTNRLPDGRTAFFKPLIDPAQKAPLVLSFANLVEAHVLTAIRRQHEISMPRVRAALDYLRTVIKSKRPLLEQQFETNRVDLFVQHLGETINISRRGQVEMADMLKGFLQRIERDASGLPIKLYLVTRNQPVAQQPRSVVVDPRVSFGRPVIVNTGIPTAVLAERYKAGDTMEALAADYGTSQEAIEEAIRCELRAA
jgi:uncharacterized protein (DUF433 family)